MPISYISAVILLHVGVWLNALALLFCLKTLAKMETKCFQLFKKKKHEKGFLCSVLIDSAVCLRWSNYTCLVAVRGRWCLIKHQAYPLLIVSQTWKLKRQSMIIALNIKLTAFNFSCYILCVFTRNVVQDVELPNRAIFTGNTKQKHVRWKWNFGVSHQELLSYQGKRSKQYSKWVSCRRFHRSNGYKSLSLFHHSYCFVSWKYLSYPGYSQEQAATKIDQLLCI